MINCTGSTITYYLTSNISDTYYLYCDKNPPSYNWNLNENTWSDCKKNMKFAYFGWNFEVFESGWYLKLTVA